MLLLLKIPAALIGLVFTLGGVIAFFWSVWLALAYALYKPSTLRLAGSPSQAAPDISAALVGFLGAVAALYVGTQLGRFARGDFD